MHAAEQPIDPHLLERIDELQVRLEHLEDLVSADEGPVEVDATASTTRTVESVTTGAEPGPGSALAQDDGPAYT